MEAQARIQQNADAIRACIAQAAARGGRDAADVRIIAVTKGVGVDLLEAAVRAGLRDVGENRIHEARAKQAAFSGAARWHMIGPVQRRKAKDVVTLFDTVHAVDRLAAAEALDRRCTAAGKHLTVYLEVNVSGEATKHGVAQGDVAGAVDAIRAMDGLVLAGLMTMAPWTDNPEQTRPVFRRLRHLAQDNGLTRLSMGMSNDYEIAVEEGATDVRIGTALFA